ncbi:MAG TPA: PEP-CTERM sorting domain-containing protein [Rhizomicrobium sp.]|nr:PEP-CTERM sorting domain-containing protein [Rhizomicrobium sp.]
MNIRIAKTAIATTFLLAFLVAPADRALASTMVAFHLNGQGISGDGIFTIEPDVSPPDPNTLCGTAGQNPCRADPSGAFMITNVTGSFTDEALGIFGAPITGLVATSPADERDPTFDPLVPSSLSFTGAGLSYNNLYFPNGSPIDCDYPFLGTYLDVFGTAFTITGGDIVNFWGDGFYPPVGALTYGVGVAEGDNVIDYRFAGITAPEPLTFSLFGAGLVGAAATRRRRRRKQAM